MQRPWETKKLRGNTHNNRLMRLLELNSFCSFERFLGVRSSFLQLRGLRITVFVVFVAEKLLLLLFVAPWAGKFLALEIFIPCLYLASGRGKEAELLQLCGVGASTVEFFWNWSGDYLQWTCPVLETILKEFYGWRNGTATAFSCKWKARSKVLVVIHLHLFSN